MDDRMTWWLAIFVLIEGVLSQMEVLHSWRQVDFNFPGPSLRDVMIRSGLFKPENVALIDVDIWTGLGLGRKVFVTMPRFKPGTPATLATVGGNGILNPYPDWAWHREGNCDGMTSVFRTQIDDCGRLWVLDSGTIEIFSEKPKRICRPQILIFDLNNDKLVERYHFPEHVVDNDALLVTIAVDTRDPKCHDSFAYIADVVSFKLIVYDGIRRQSWKVSNNYFYPYPLQGSFKISGVHFDLMDGILGLALGPQIGDDRRLFFHSLASVRESWVSTSILRNSSIFLKGDGAPRAFHVYPYTRPSQAAAEAMSDSGVLFFGLLGNNSIACWNSRLPYTRDNIISVAQDKRIQFTSGMKIHNGFLWVLSTRFQDYLADHVDPIVVNHRIMVASLASLTLGTTCSDPFDNFIPPINPINYSYQPFFDRFLLFNK